MHYSTTTSRIQAVEPYWNRSLSLVMKTMEDRAWPESVFIGFCGV